MQTLTVLIGPSGSGKSTWTKKNAKAGDIVINMDTIRESICGDPSDQSKNQEVFKIAIKTLRDALSQGHSVIWDNTSRTPKSRREVLRIAEEFKIRKCAVLFTVPFDVCVKRNALRERKVPLDVIQRQFNDLTQPVADEGFEIIEFVNE